MWWAAFETMATKEKALTYSTPTQLTPEKKQQIDNIQVLTYIKEHATNDEIL